MAAYGPEPGLVISGRYRLESLLGQGGMGSVWRAQHLALNAPVAVKLIDPTIASSPEAQARFLREAQAAAALRSPNVVQTLDFGVDEGIPYIVMELLVGESLADRLTRCGRLLPAETARIVGEIAKAIGKAHAAEIVHRDLKPDNVFLARDEDEEVVKVVDFGVAKATGMVGASTSKTRTGAVLGTPYYMSPEQAQGDKRVDWRTDLWALAVIAYECLVGRRPFEADGLGSLIMQICASPIPVPSQHGPVPPGFDAWWSRATDRDPARRFQSARELATTLRAAVGDGGPPLSPGSYGEAFRASEPGVPGYAPAVPVVTPHPDLSGSQPDPPTVPLHQSGGAAVAVTTGQATTTSALANDEIRIPKRGGFALVLFVILGFVVLVGGAVGVALLAMSQVVGGRGTVGGSVSAEAGEGLAIVTEPATVTTTDGSPGGTASATVSVTPGSEAATGKDTGRETGKDTGKETATATATSTGRGVVVAGPRTTGVGRSTGVARTTGTGAATPTTAKATATNTVKATATRRDRLGF